MMDRGQTGFFARLYLRLKYTLLGRSLDLPAGAEGRRGFILVQIDGLSYPALQKAMGKGYTPTFRRLMRRRGYRLIPYHCPAPSNTPYFQTGLMYGNNSGVLGFRWLEKGAGLNVTFKDAASAALIEERAAAGRRGILSRGSSYLNLFSGDAERSVFTLSTFATRNLLRKRRLRQLDIFLLFFLTLSNLFRTALYLLTDTLLELWEWISLLLSGRRRRSEGIFLFIRLINNVIIREIETTGAMTDIIRGVPAVHVTYNGYDEMAHHRGPEFPGAFRVLRGIDRKIGKIARAAGSSAAREYDLYILSDHGQTPSAPFSSLYGETLAGLIQRATPERLEITEFNSPQEAILHEAWKYLEEAAFFTRNLPRFIYNGAERLRALIVRGRPQILPFVWKQEAEQIFVNDSGPLAHLYFNFRTEKIEVGVISEKHPALFEALLAHPGIGVLIGHGGEGEPVILKWDDNLPPSARENLLTLAREPHAGDLILQGTFDGSSIVNFEEQLSAHGGIGGAQNNPFFLLPPHISLDPSGIGDPRELYPFFYENYTRYVIGGTETSGHAGEEE